MTTQKTDRNQAAISMFADGFSYVEIGERFGISANRARVIVQRYSKEFLVGGFSLSVAMKRLDAECKKEAACISKYGFCRKTLEHLRRIGATKAFKVQRLHAKSRGIDFNLSLKDWWSIWDESGKYELRGRGASGYCMARTGDAGPYEVGNVSIKTVIENSSEGQRNRVKRCSKTGRERGTSTFGSGRGWTYVSKCKTKPYCVQIAGLKQTHFPTQQEAESFYKLTTAAILSGSAVVRDGKIFHLDGDRSHPKQIANT